MINIKIKNIKNYSLIIIVFALFIFSVNLIYAQTTNNTNYGLGYSYYDFYSYGMATGFVISPYSNYPFSFLINPAYGAKLADNDFSFLISGFSNFIIGNTYYSFDTVYGNVTFFLSYMNQYGVSPNNNILFRTNFAKLINEDFWVGVALNFITDGFTNFGMNFDLGISSKTPYEAFNGFGFKNLAWGIVLNNIGYPAKINSNYYPPIGLIGSISFDFLNISNNLVVTFIDNLFLNFYPFSIGNGSNININIFKFLDLNFGIKLAYLDYLSVFSYHLGISFYIPINKDNNIYISYGYSNNSNNNPIHTVNFNYTFGGIDKKAPITKIKVDKNKFSPNYDGVKDEVNIFPKFEDNSIIFGWKIIIMDEKGNIVKVFEAEDVRKVRYVTLDKIFNRLFAKKEQVKIPEFISWDGTDYEGKVLPDGKYFIYAISWDENNNEGRSEIIEVLIDTKINKFEVKETTEFDMFSPNGDGRKETYNAKIAFSKLDEDEWILVQIFDENDNLINSFKLDKNYINNNTILFSWDGMTNKNTLAPEGFYKIVFRAEDEAGNILKLDERKVTLVRTYEVIKSYASSEYLAPTGNGKNDTIIFINNITSSENIIFWELIIKDKNNNEVFKQNGDGNIPDKFVWDGIDKNKKLVSDGRYIYFIKAKFKSGNEPVSNEVNFTVDTKPPVIIITEEYLAFSPDGDGNKDTLKIIVEVKDEDNINVIKDILFINPYKQNLLITPLNKKIISDKKIEIVLDGYDLERREIPQGNYIVLINTEDNAGNSAKYSSKEIKLVRVVEEVYVDSNLAYYSPNNDNFNDLIIFKVDAKEKNGIVKTTFYIVGSDGQIKIKKEFKGLPENIQFNDKLENGQYYYYIEVEYDSGIKSKSYDKKYFITDLVSPEVTISLDNRYFSPNNDGNNDVLIVNLKSNEPLLKYDVIIKRGNSTVGTYKIENVSEKYILDGKNLSDGDYLINFIFYDNAGNRTSKEESFFINRESPKINASTNDIPVISPNFDNFRDFINININIDDSNIIKKDKLKNVRISIKNSKNESVIVKDFNTKIENFKFDGIIEGKKTLETGNYDFVIEAFYESGIYGIFELKDILVDLEAPKIDTVIKPDLFSPDNDGFNDELFVTFNTSDNYKLSECIIQIFRVYDEKTISKNPIKTFTYKNLTSDKFSIIEKWDGIGDDPKYKVDSAADYKIFFYAKDFAGNEIRITQDFTVDILVEKIERDGKVMYRIILNSITFAFNSDKLDRNSFAILDKLVEKLNKFKDYRIRIIGYTDNIGDYNYNIQLSIRRAKSVYDYLVRKDIDPKRLTYEGRGPNDPIDTNDTEDGRRRNRRVEFYLER
ncbi:MAG: OmpA family protein [Spirochaetes bacterium]|nr:OmpA family protein [Spirochaetota bacterium]